MNKLIIAIGMVLILFASMVTAAGDYNDAAWVNQNVGKEGFDYSELEDWSLILPGKITRISADDLEYSKLNGYQRLAMNSEQISANFEHINDLSTDVHPRRAEEAIENKYKNSGIDVSLRGPAKIRGNVLSSKDGDSVSLGGTNYQNGLLTVGDDGTITFTPQEGQTSIEIPRYDSVRADSAGRDLDTALPGGNARFNGQLSYVNGQAYVRAGDEVVINGVKISDDVIVEFYADGKEHDGMYVSANTDEKIIIVKGASIALIDDTYANVQDDDVLEFHPHEDITVTVTNREHLELGPLHPLVTVKGPKGTADWGTMINGKLAFQMNTNGETKLDPRRYRTTGGSVPMQIEIENNGIDAVLIDNHNQFYLVDYFQEGAENRVVYDITIDNLIEQEEKLGVPSHEFTTRSTLEGHNPYRGIIDRIIPADIAEIKYPDGTPVPVEEIIVSRGDFHVHSEKSYDSDKTGKAIIDSMDQMNLDVISITDHNSIAIYESLILDEDGNAALDHNGRPILNDQGNPMTVMEYANSKGKTLIPGVEITSEESIHICVYFQDLKSAKNFMESMDYDEGEVDPTGQSALEIARIAHLPSIGGKVVPAHPADGIVGLKDAIALGSISREDARLFSGEVDGWEAITGNVAEGINEESIEFIRVTAGRKQITQTAVPEEGIPEISQVVLDPTIPKFGSSDRHIIDHSTAYTSIYTSEQITAENFINNLGTDQMGTVPQGHRFTDEEYSTAYWNSVWSMNPAYIFTEGGASLAKSGREGLITLPKVLGEYFHGPPKPAEQAKPAPPSDTTPSPEPESVIQSALDVAPK